MTAVVAVFVVVSLAGGGAALAAGGDRRRRAQSRVRPADRSGPPPWFAAALGALDLGADPARVWPVLRGCGVLALAGLAVTAPGAALVALALVVAGPHVATVVIAGRAGDERLAEADLPRVVDTWVAALGSGASLAQAIEASPSRAGSGSQGLDLVLARHRRGEPLQVALDRWASTHRSTGAPLVADALALAGSSGASQVRALERVAATVRERAALRREVSALGAQARLSALVLVLVPLAFALVVASLDARVRHVLVATPLGWVCLGAGVALDLAGAGWMRRLVGPDR